MSAVKRICVRILTAVFICSVRSDLQEQKAKPGEDVPFQCRGHSDAVVRMLKWVRPDLKSEGFVFYLRENRPYENYQHPSFHGRVELRDPEIKNGDFSVILKNVNINDTGTYECYVGFGDKIELISSFTLTVEPGHTDKHGGDKEKPTDDSKGGNTPTKTGLIVGLLIVGVLVVAVIGFVIYKRPKGPTDNSSRQHYPGEPAELRPL